MQTNPRIFSRPGVHDSLSRATLKSRRCVPRHSGSGLVSRSELIPIILSPKYSPALAANAPKAGEHKTPTSHFPSHFHYPNPAHELYLVFEKYTSPLHSDDCWK